MATTTPANAKWAHQPPETQEHEDEEEEALSLCDLPINNQQNHQRTKEEEETQAEKAPPSPTKPEDDFDFKSWCGSLSTQPPPMCAADDVFFQGQIIPLRHSVSSEGGLTEAALSRTGKSQPCISRSGSTPSRPISRSESMDHFHSITGFNSRSSSVRSLRSSSSGSSTGTTTTTYHQKHKVLNHFHSHPSPSPQIRTPSYRYTNTGNRVPKSQVWSLFRVGLVHTPEIELQGLRNRNGSRNGNQTGFGFGSRNSNSSSNSSTSSGEKNKKNKQRFFGKNIGGGFFSGGGCRCTVDAVETMPLRVVVKVEGDDEEEKEKGKARKEKKQTASRHRTFEWLKELADAGVPD